jgi:hypothetical protein
MHRDIAFWIKFICKQYWFEKESLKLPNNNYGVLLMKHLHVYWQSETIWWRYIFWGMYGIMDFFLNKVNDYVLRYCFFLAMLFFKIIKLACLYTVLQIWQLLWLKTPKKNNSQIFNFSVQMMYVVNKVDKWKSTI